MHIFNCHSELEELRGVRREEAKKELARIIKSEEGSDKLRRALSKSEERRREEELLAKQAVRQVFLVE